RPARPRHPGGAPGCARGGVDRWGARRRRGRRIGASPVDMEGATERLEIARVGRPHGVRGDVMITLTTNVQAPLAVRATGWIGDRGVPVGPARPHQGRHIVPLSGVDERDAASALTGVRVFALPIDDAPDGEVWVHEVIGATVTDRSGRAYGAVVAVEAN